METPPPDFLEYAIESNVPIFEYFNPLDSEYKVPKKPEFKAQIDWLVCLRSGFEDSQFPKFGSFIVTAHNIDGLIKPYAIPSLLISLEEAHRREFHSTFTREFLHNCLKMAGHVWLKELFKGHSELPECLTLVIEETLNIKLRKDV